MDSAANRKVHCSILKTFLNDKNCLIFHQFVIITIILLILKIKAQIFNNFFAKQCTLVENTSRLSINYFKKTSNQFPMISFTKDDIAKIIQNLDSNKVHAYVMISIRMFIFVVIQSLNPQNLYLNHALRIRKSQFIKK